MHPAVSVPTLKFTSLHPAWDNVGIIQAKPFKFLVKAWVVIPEDIPEKENSPRQGETRGVPHGIPAVPGVFHTWQKSITVTLFPQPGDVCKQKSPWDSSFPCQEST